MLTTAMITDLSMDELYIFVVVFNQLCIQPQTMLMTIWMLDLTADLCICICICKSTLQDPKLE